jgi:hypothetical protein
VFCSLASARTWHYATLPPRPTLLPSSHMHSPFCSNPLALVSNRTVLPFHSFSRTLLRSHTLSSFTQAHRYTFIHSLLTNLFAEYYLNTNGIDDPTNNCNQTSPCRTLAYVASFAAHNISSNASTIIIFEAGNYSIFSLSFL